MGALSLSPLSRYSGLAPLVIRLVVGLIMSVHGLQKLMGGPAAFGGFLDQLGVPLPVVMGFVVTFVELVGGIMLILGLLSRWAGLLLAINLTVAALLVKTQVGLIAPATQPGVGAELDLALIAGFLAVLLVGPGKVSLDYLLGIERGRVEVPSLQENSQGGREATI